jgi:hypothetical protein
VTDQLSPVSATAAIFPAASTIVCRRLFGKRCSGSAGLPHAGQSCTFLMEST